MPAATLSCSTINPIVLVCFQEIPGLDFERYLQPSLRCSLSPRETEMLSPMAADVEMESPRGQSEDLLTQKEAGMTDAVHTVHLGSTAC